MPSANPILSPADLLRRSGARSAAAKARNKLAGVALGMGRVVEVEIPGEPPCATHHRKIARRTKGKRVILVYTPELADAKEHYATALLLSGRRPATPLDGPLRMDVAFVFQHPTRTDGYDEPPDRDNLVKTFTDALARAGFIANDCRVCAGEVEKRWGPVGMVWVRVEELSGGGPCST
jgi:Holliday junction resolvase RusA-like endonuclease